MLFFCYFFVLLSDAFDFQYGAVILRLQEGLDVSHIQGQGIRPLPVEPLFKKLTPHMAIIQGIQN